MIFLLLQLLSDVFVPMSPITEALFPLVSNYSTRDKNFRSNAINLILLLEQKISVVKIVEGFSRTRIFQFVLVGFGFLIVEVFKQPSK